MAGCGRTAASASGGGNLAAVGNLPARFGTIFLGEDSLRQHVKERKSAIGKSFERVADADEWGIKLFDIARPKRAAVVAASGSDYLKKKAEMLQPRAGKKLDNAGQEFVAALDQAGSCGQPGRKSQRWSAGTGVARIVSDSQARPEEAGDHAEEVRHPVARRSANRVQRSLASVFVCGGACPLSRVR